MRALLFGLLAAALCLSGCAAYDNGDFIQPAGTTALGKYSAISLVELDRAIGVANMAAEAQVQGAADLKTCLVKVRAYVEIVHNAATGMTSPLSTGVLLYLMKDDAKAALERCGDALRAT